MARVTEKQQEFQEKVIFIAKSNVGSIHAGKLVKEVAIYTGGNGGGRPDFAQAGGKDITKVSQALELAKEIVVKSI